MGGGEGWGVIGDLGSGSYGVGSTARRRVMTFWGLPWRMTMIDDLIEEKDLFLVARG